MKREVRTVDSLSASDLERHSVWRFVCTDHTDEACVVPVKRVPVNSLTGRLVGTQVTLANGNRVWALLGNVEPNSGRMTEHFLTLSVERGGSWFTLARYHDFDFSERGPDALARFLELSRGDVFPIAYDIRGVVVGSDDALRGFVRESPRERLSRSEIIGMAVP